MDITIKSVETIVTGLPNVMVSYSFHYGKGWLIIISYKDADFTAIVVGKTVVIGLEVFRKTPHLHKTIDWFDTEDEVRDFLLPLTEQDVELLNVSWINMVRNIRADGDEVGECMFSITLSELQEYAKTRL